MNKPTKRQLERISEDIRETIGEETKVSVNLSRSFPKDVPEFIMVFQRAGRELFKVLTPGACKVFGYMLSLMEYSNHIGTDQKTFSEVLGLSLRTVNGAIKELQSHNVIIKYSDPQDKRRMVYMINAHAAWKGKVHKRQKHIKSNPNQTILFEHST